MDYIVHEGVAYYDLKRVCNTLGLNYQHQQRRLTGNVFKFAEQGQAKKHITQEEYQRLLNGLLHPLSITKLSDDTLYRVRKAYGELAAGEVS